MNYSKSLSELLFEEKLSSNTSKDVIEALELNDISKLTTFLVDKSDLEKFKLAVKNGQTNILSQFLMASNREKSNYESTPKDIQGDTSAKDVDGLELGDKIINIKFSDLRNKLAKRLADRLKPMVVNDKVNADLATLNNAQKKKISDLGIGPAKISYLNIAGEDKLASSGKDIKEYDDIGHAFFMILGSDPEDGQKASYYSNGGKIIIFAHPTRGTLIGKAKEIHEKIFNVNISESLSIENKLVHEQSLTSFLFEQGGAAAGESQGIYRSFSDDGSETDNKKPRYIRADRNSLDTLLARPSMQTLNAYLNDQGITEDNAYDKKEGLQKILDKLSGETLSFDDDDNYREVINRIQGLLTPPTNPPSSISPPSGDDDYGDNVHADTVNKLPSDMDGINILKNPGKGDIEKVNAIKPSMKSSHAEKLEAALSGKAKDKTHKIKINYTPINNGKKKSIKCDVKWKGDKWIFVIEGNIYVYGESFVYKEGLSLLLEADSKAGFKDFQLLSRDELEDDMDMLDLADGLSFAIIDNITVSDKEEKTTQQTTSSPESSPAGPTGKPTDDSQPAGDEAPSEAGQEAELEEKEIEKINKSIIDGKDQELNLKNLTAAELREIVEYSIRYYLKNNSVKAFAIVNPERDKHIRYFYQKSDKKLILDTIPEAAIETDQDALDFCKNNNLSILTFNEKRPDYSEETEEPAESGAGAKAAAQTSEEPSPSEEASSGQGDQSVEPGGDKQDDETEGLTGDQKQKLSSLKQEIKSKTNLDSDLDDSLFTNEIKVTGNLTSKEDLLAFYAGFYCFANNLDASNLTRDIIVNFYKNFHPDRFARPTELRDNVFVVDDQLKLAINCAQIINFNLGNIVPGRMDSIETLALAESNTAKKRFDKNMTVSKAKIQSVKDLFSKSLKGQNNAKISIDLSRVFKTEKVVKDKEGKIIDPETIKQSIEEDLKKIYAVFSAKKGLSDINLEKISLEKFTSLKDYKIEPDKIYKVVQQELSDSEIGLFLIEFLTEFLKRFGGEKDIANAVLKRALNNESLKKELETYFNLQSIKSLLEESKKRNKNLLKENWLLDGAVGLFGSGVDAAIDGILTLIGSSVYLKWGCLILAGIGVEWTTGAISGLTKSGSNLVKSYFENLEESSDKEAKWLATIISSGNTIQNTRNLVALLVSATVSACLKEKYNFRIIGSLSEVEKDSNIDDNILELLEKEISVSITQQTQADLFTKTFRDNTLKGKEDLEEGQKDQELIKAYESRLNNLVLGYMNVALEDEAYAAQQEKERIAYRNRMDVMDSEVLSGMGIGTLSAVLVGISPLGPIALAAAPVLAFYGGKKRGEYVKSKQVDIGEKEIAFNSKKEDNKQIARLIVIELAKKSLGIKNESLYSDDYLYRHGLSLLIEGLEDRLLLEEEEAKTELPPEESKNIRGKISFTSLSDRLEADNFFLFSPEYALRNKESAVRLQYEFASSLAAITRYCFGVDITGVDKLSIRDTQANSYTQMMVNGSAGIGEGSIKGARTKGGSGKGLEDTISMEEFASLINNFDGDTTKAALFLMLNGKLDGLLSAIKGGKQTAQEVIESIGAAISGNLGSMPGGIKESAEEAIQNLGSKEWVKKVIEAYDKDAPIILFYDSKNEIDEDFINDFINDKVARYINDFSVGYQSGNIPNTFGVGNVKLNYQNMSIENHLAFITKSKSEGGREVRSQYRFTCSEEAARRLVFDGVRINDKYIDDSEKSSDMTYTLKASFRDEQSVFNSFEVTTNEKDLQSHEIDKLAKRIAAVLIIKIMRKSPTSKARKYQASIVNKQIDQMEVSGRDFTLALANIFLKNKATLVQTDSDDPNARERAQQQNIRAVTTALEEQHKMHLDLYKMWKSR